MIFHYIGGLYSKFFVIFIYTNCRVTWAINSVEEIIILQSFLFQLFSFFLSFFLYYKYISPICLFYCSKKRVYSPLLLKVLKAIWLLILQSKENRCFSSVQFSISKAHTSFYFWINTVFTCSWIPIEVEITSLTRSVKVFKQKFNLATSPKDQQTYVF